MWNTVLLQKSDPVEHKLKPPNEQQLEIISVWKE